MANYVFVYKGGGMAATEAEQQAAMAAWMQWFGGLAGAVVDPGTPFGPSKSVGTNGSVNDGGGSRLTGYSVIKADNLDSAAGMAKKCPILGNGGSVEIYETIPIPM
jgi:hypothetical protein